MVLLLILFIISALALFIYGIIVAASIIWTLIEIAAVGFFIWIIIKVLTQSSPSLQLSALPKRSPELER